MFSVFGAWSLSQENKEVVDHEEIIFYVIKKVVFTKRITLLTTLLKMKKMSNLKHVSYPICKFKTASARNRIVLL